MSVPDAHDELLLEHAVDRFGAQCEAEWLSGKGVENYTSQFLEHGYYVAPIPMDAAEAIKRYFRGENVVSIGAGPVRHDYVNAQIDPAVAAQLNQKNIYYGEPGPAVATALESYFESIRDDIENQLAHGWEIANVRAWSVKPNVDFGANIWHSDGFSRYVRKFLIFVNPPNGEAGTTEITTRKGEVMEVKADTPVCVLYDSAVLTHRGRSPKSQARPIIEVTIVPTRQSSARCVFAGQLARVPVNLAEEFVRDLAPTRYVPERRNGVRVGSLRRLSKKLPKVVAAAKKQLKKSLGTSKTERKLPAVTNLTGRLNLGGGRRWQHRGWINLEGVPGPANPYPIWFSDEVFFPVPSSSIQLAYSSHCLEHLDDATVERMLRETRRVLNGDGVLVLKLPDCDEVIARWRKGDERFFHEQWRFGKVSHTWASRGVGDSLDNRAAYIFCGFWNQAFGEHFGGRNNRNLHKGEAYNGPPLQAEHMAGELRSLDSPHEISVRLRQSVIDTETDFSFNHQNAWGRDELTTLLARSGFRVESFDAADIMRRHDDVPGIELMQEISVYCRAVPV